ncbi:MAG: amidohydrolase family protein [Gemmatimonadetes bacterium]|nr:amidohydrolase family protein [Gemmatimonadota bacterium]
MNRTFAPLRRVVAAVAFVVPVLLGAQGGTWALTNARVETVTRGVIEKGTIVIRDGLIAAVGADVPIPADARVLDLAGRTVAPGLIDLTSTIGLPGAATAAPVGGRAGGAAGGGAASADRFTGFEADRVIADEVRVSPAEARAAREGGVTAALVAPPRGAVRGLSALVPMKDSAGGADVIKSPVAEHFGFIAGNGFGAGGTNARGDHTPGTIMGVVAYQRQELYDAKRHALLEERWKADPRGLARPEHDPDLDALVPVVLGRMPVFYDAPQENDIRRAARIDKELFLRFTIVGATEGWRALDALEGHPVVVSVNFPAPSTVTGWSYRYAMRHESDDSAAADRAARTLIEGNAEAIHKAGLRFALASGGTNATAFVSNVRKAVAAGLPADVALQAVTIRAAEMAGLGAALGSVEPGKIANLVVTDGGNVLAADAKVRAVFVDGTRYDVVPAAGGRGGSRDGGPPSATANGTFNGDKTP